MIGRTSLRRRRRGGSGGGVVVSVCVRCVCEVARPFCASVKIAIENVEAIVPGSGPGSNQTHAHLSGRGAARPARVLRNQSGGAADAQWHGKGRGISKYRPFFLIIATRQPFFRTHVRLFARS